MEKAESYIKQADKKYNSRSFFGSKTNDWEEASDLYSKAANIYKMSKKYDEAGKAFIKAGECHLKLHDKYNAANNYINAANSFKKVNISETIKLLKLAVELFADDGKLSQVARYTKEIASIYEEEKDMEEAITFYQKAIDYYESENDIRTTNHCLLKVADYWALNAKSEQAIELYERIINTSLNNTMKWFVKDYILKCCLCHLVTGDYVGVRKTIDKYSELYPSFTSQREYKLLLNILTCCENNNLTDFTNELQEYDEIQKLDLWMISILTKIKSLFFDFDQTL